MRLGGPPIARSVPVETGAVGCAELAQDLSDQFGEACDKRSQQRAILAPVAGFEIRYRVFDGVFKQHSCAIIERMSTGRWWFDPGDANRKRPEERTRNTHRKNRGAKVMPKPWERNLGGGTTPANLGVALPHYDRNAGTSERYRRRKAVRTRSDDSGGWHEKMSLTLVIHFPYFR
jgi:hypothetical protein